MKHVEQLKQKHALALEAQRWEYRKRELQYLEAGQHQRSLNQLMWQVPGMAIAITGGLWYGATTSDAELPRVWIFGFTVIVDLLTVVILWRLRDLIEVHIKQQQNFNSIIGVRTKWPRRTVISCWTIALISAATVSGFGCFYPGAVSKLKSQERSEIQCNLSIDLALKRCTAGSKKLTDSLWK